MVRVTSFGLVLLTIDCFRMGCVTQGEAVVDDVLRLVCQGADVNFQARASPACCYDYHQLTSLCVCAWALTEAECG